jgi:predicted RNA-binding Zn-ribbon protein involved in translation (DUF1610 family)
VEGSPFPGYNQCVEEEPILGVLLMPAYPCSKCSNKVDVRDVNCRQCGEKKPFTCAKCGTQLGAFEIHDVDRISFQKALFCNTCGRAGEILQCSHCRTDIKRSEGMQIGDRIYHQDCFKTTQLQVKASKALMFILIPMLAWAGWSLHHIHPVMGVVGVILGGLAGWFGSTLMAPKK